MAMKKFKYLAIVLVIALTLTMVTSASSPSSTNTSWDPSHTEFRIGKVEGNNPTAAITISDALEILKTLARIKTTSQVNTFHKCSGDGNGNSQSMPPVIVQCTFLMFCANHVCAVAENSNPLGDTFTPAMIPAHSPTFPSGTVGGTPTQQSIAAANNTFHLNFNTLTNETARNFPNNPDGALNLGVGRWLVFDRPAGLEGEPAMPNTLEIRRGGVYVLSGNLNNGQILINAFNRPARDNDDGDPKQGRIREEVTLILNGVTITNNDGPAIEAFRSSKVNIVIVDGTTNVLTDSTNYVIDTDRYGDADAGEDVSPPNGTIFSRHDISVLGRGNLTINGNHRHGISSRDIIEIRGGNITINTNIGGFTGSGADQLNHSTVGNTIHGRDGVIIRNGTFTLNAANHAVRANNNTGATGPADAPAIVGTAAEPNGSIHIRGGTFNIRAGGDAFRAAVNATATRRSRMEISGANFTSIVTRLSSEGEPEE
jgi:hypothetical protein